MKHRYLTALSLILLLFCGTMDLGALDLEVTGGVNFLTFHPDKTFTGYSDPLGGGSRRFQPYPFVVANIGVKDDISETLAYSVNFSRDNITGNSLDGRIFAKTDYFNIEFGPFIGMIDALEKPFFGMLGSLEFMYPGVFFVNISGSATLGSQFDFTGDHIRETAEVKAGFWLYFMIPSVSASYKNFTRQLGSDDYIKDTLTRLQLSIDFHIKNSPITLRADAGYETLSRYYYDDTDDITDELNAFYGGFELNWQLRKIKIKFAAEMPLVINTRGLMTSPQFYSMPKITAGFVYSFN